MKINLILISDSLRYDIAKESKYNQYNINKAYSMSNNTLGFFSNLVNGNFVSEYRVNKLRKYFGMDFTPGITWLEEIKSKGWTTCFLTGMPWFSPLNTTFESTYNLFDYHYFDKVTHDDSKNLNDKFIQFCRTTNADKIFGIIWYGETHSPYTTQKHQYKWEFDKDGYKSGGKLPKKFYDWCKMAQKRAANEVCENTDKLVKKLKEISEGRILITADHGESMGEKNQAKGNGSGDLFGHGAGHNIKQFEVPLIIIDYSSGNKKS